MSHIRCFSVGSTSWDAVHQQAAQNKCSLLCSCNGAVAALYIVGNTKGNMQHGMHCVLCGLRALNSAMTCAAWRLCAFDRAVPPALSCSLTTCCSLRKVSMLVTAQGAGAGALMQQQLVLVGSDSSAAGWFQEQQGKLPEALYRTASTDADAASLPQVKTSPVLTRSAAGPLACQDLSKVPQPICSCQVEGSSCAGISVQPWGNAAASDHRTAANQLWLYMVFCCTTHRAVLYVLANTATAACLPGQWALLALPAFLINSVCTSTRLGM